MKPNRGSFLFALLCLFTADGLAFNPPEATEGPLKVEIEALDTVRALDQPFETEVHLANRGSAALNVKLEVWVVDDFRIGPDGSRRMEKTIQIAGGATEEIALKITPGSRGTYNAHYPIHARATFRDPESGQERQAHAIKILVVEAPNPASREKPTKGPIHIQAGVTSLLNLRRRLVWLQQGPDGPTRILGVGWSGSDAETGATFQRASVDRGGRLACFSVHPPWRKGWGTIWADYDLVLPETKPITLTFSNAIRDNTEKEPPSDGVEFRVDVQSFAISESPFLTLFRRFTKSKTWEEASVDLSPHAGSYIRLRLWAGPGPANNTVCDSGYWGNPVVVAGPMPPKSSSWRGLFRSSYWAAEAAFKGEQPKSPARGWRINSDAGIFGVGYNQSEGGPAHAAIAIVAAEEKFLRFPGFDIEIDGTPLGDFPGARMRNWSETWKNGRFVTEDTLLLATGPTRVRAEFWVEPGAFRCRFSMPGVKRDKRGHPRFTRIGIGPVGKARRVYAGFGNVIEKPGGFDLHDNGFQLSTRHVGVDYENGLSLVQACDVFPDRLHVDPDRGVCSLQTHHDATISLIPSEKGAFAAAKVYREGIAGFKPSPGYEKLLGKMCLDYWGTSYQHGIDTVETLAKYGVTDCVYVWHNWQRWGYDYRLPEIYPARGDHALFLKLAETCKKHGILFCPHDNYIDFYPDAERFSYDHVIFNEDGTPQKAWYNRGRGAQSYRWLPHAFHPWMEKNIALLKQDVKPTAYFIDVFTAIAPMDYYDRSGRFYPKTRTIAEWSKCFDYVREQFDGAPQISEAGHDTQIGHIAASESDHMGVVPNKRSGQWGWYIPCADGERTPWHDMASHGSFILFAGGLANRYVGELDRRAHGYGSDDYLSLTVLGGRNPMTHGDATAETIRTYWLLHDICAELGKRPITSHEFAADDIHRQIVEFGEDAVVYVNRGENDWQFRLPQRETSGMIHGPQNVVLPPYGFVAIAGGCYAEIRNRNGAVSSKAIVPGGVFVDARPPLGDGKNDRPVIDFDGFATNGTFRFSWGEVDHARGVRTLRIIMLPGCPASEIRFKESVPGDTVTLMVTQIQRLDDDGTPGGPVAFQRSDDVAVFNTSPGDFGYQLEATLKR